MFSQDLGFIAVIENGKLAGYNVTVGGGLAMSHGNADTFPRLADVMGFITPDRVNAIGAAVITTQRDFGDRTNRKHARLKYTIEDRGLRTSVALYCVRPDLIDGATLEKIGYASGRTRQHIHKLAVSFRGTTGLTS